MAVQRIPHGEYMIFVSDDGKIADRTAKYISAAFTAAIGVAMIFIGPWLVGGDIGNRIMLSGIMVLIYGTLGAMLLIPPRYRDVYKLWTDYPGIGAVTSEIVETDKSETTRLLCAAIRRIRDAVDADIKQDEGRSNALKNIISNCK